MRNVDVSHHYIVASEHVEAIENYLEKTGKKNISTVRALGWETGGDLSIAFEEIGDSDDAIVMNGDIITDVDMGQLYRFHREHNALVSMALLELNDEEEARRFGQVELDKDFAITEFLEKNQGGIRKSKLVNVGFYIFSREFISHRSEYMMPKKFKLERDLFPRLAHERKLFGMRMDINYWWDVGTMSSYLKAEQFFINNKGIIPP